MWFLLETMYETKNHWFPNSHTWKNKRTSFQKNCFSYSITSIDKNLIRKKMVLVVKGKMQPTSLLHNDELQTRTNTYIMLFQILYNISLWMTWLIVQQSFKKETKITKYVKKLKAKKVVFKVVLFYHKYTEFVQTHKLIIKKSLHYNAMQGLCLQF